MISKSQISIFSNNFCLFGKEIFFYFELIFPTIKFFQIRIVIVSIIFPFLVLQAVTLISCHLPFSLFLFWDFIILRSYYSF